MIFYRFQFELWAVLKNYIDLLISVSPNDQFINLVILSIPLYLP